MTDQNKVCPVHSAGLYVGVDSKGYAIYKCWCGRRMYNDPVAIKEMQYFRLVKLVGWREAHKTVYGDNK